MTVVDQEVAKYNIAEMRWALKSMKSGKEVAPDDIPVEVWNCLGKVAEEFLTKTFNKRVRGCLKNGREVCWC